jgi:hypothetical protein
MLFGSSISSLFLLVYAYHFSSPWFPRASRLFNPGGGGASKSSCQLDFAGGSLTDLHGRRSRVTGVLDCWVEACSSLLLKQHHRGVCDGDTNNPSDQRWKGQSGQTASVSSTWPLQVKCDGCILGVGSQISIRGLTYARIKQKTRMTVLIAHIGATHDPKPPAVIATRAHQNATSRMLNTMSVFRLPHRAHFSYL